MKYKDLSFDRSYDYLDLLEWWGSQELARRRLNGDIYEVGKGEYRRLD